MPRPSEEIDIQAAKEVYATLPDEQKQDIEALVARGHSRRFAMRSILAQDQARGQQAIRDVEETTLGERVGAGALGAANAMSMGFADEVRGLATAIPRLMPGGESPIDAYVRGRDVQRGEAKAAEQRNLRSTLGGEVLGNVPTLVGGLAAKVPQGIAAASRQGLSALVKQGAKVGAAGGAVGGFGYGEGVGGSLEQAAKGAAIGGLFGAAGGAVGGLPGALRPRGGAAPVPASAPVSAGGPNVAQRAAAKVASALEAKPGSAKDLAKGFVDRWLPVKEVEKFAKAVPQPAPVAPRVPGMPEWQPAVGSSTADVSALAPKAPPGEVTAQLSALKAKMAAEAARPAPPPLPPEATFAGRPQEPPPNLRSKTNFVIPAEDLRGQMAVSPGAGGEVPPQIPPLSLTPEQVANVRRAVAVGNDVGAIAKALKVPEADVAAVVDAPEGMDPARWRAIKGEFAQPDVKARQQAAITPARRTPAPAEPPPTGTTVQIGEPDVVAAMSPEAFETGEGALRRLRYGQEARSVLESIGERVGEKRPQYLAELKGEIRQGFADPGAVSAKVDELLTRGVDPDLVNQALAARRSQEATEIARLTRKGGTDVVDDMVAAAMAGGAKTMQDVQRRTGLKMSEIEQAWERHEAPRLPKEPRKPKGQPAGPGSENVINPAAPIGPGKAVWAPVYEEIFGEPFHVSGGEAAREAAARLPFGPEDAQGRMIFDLRSQGWQPRQIAQKLGITLDVVRGILKQRQPKSALKPKPKP